MCRGAGLGLPGHSEGRQMHFDEVDLWSLMTWGRFVWSSDWLVVDFDFGLKLTHLSLDVEIAVGLRHDSPGRDRRTNLASCSYWPDRNVNRSR